MVTVDVIAIAGFLSAIAVIGGITYKIAKPILAVTHGIKSLLRYRINRECQRTVNRGWITSDEIEDINDLYESYRSLGGNGTVKKFYEEALNCTRVSEAEADRLRQDECYYKLALKMLGEQEHE